jgi:hypothetical protein
VSSSALRFELGRRAAVELGSWPLLGRASDDLTGLPRHSTVIFSPGFKALISTRPSAGGRRARRLEALMKGTTTKPPMAPAQLDAMIQVRHRRSSGRSCFVHLVARGRSNATREVNPEF